MYKTAQYICSFTDLAIFAKFPASCIIVDQCFMFSHNWSELVKNLYICISELATDTNFYILYLIMNTKNWFKYLLIAAY